MFSCVDLVQKNIGKKNMMERSWRKSPGYLPSYLNWGWWMCRWIFDGHIWWVDGIVLCLMEIYIYIYIYIIYDRIKLYIDGIYVFMYMIVSQLSLLFFWTDGWYKCSWEIYMIILEDLLQKMNDPDVFLRFSWEKYDHLQMKMDEHGSSWA